MRALRLVLILSALGLLLISNLPVRAAGVLTWSDPAGDATGFDPLPPPAPGVATATPRPSDPTIDLIELTAASDGKVLTFRARTSAEGFPAGATGSTIRFVFEFAGTGYQLVAQRTSPEFATAISSGVFFRSREPRSAELPCRECQVRYEPKSASVIVTATLTSLAAGIKAHNGAAPKFGPGSTLSKLVVLGQRNLVPLERSVDLARTATADVATAGAATLTA